MATKGMIAGSHDFFSGDVRRSNLVASLQMHAMHIPQQTVQQ